MPETAEKCLLFKGNLVVFFKQNNGKLTGRYKQQGKAKYNKWKEEVDAGTTPEKAEEEYIKLGEELVAKYDN